MRLLVLVAVFAAAIPLVILAARRFERRQQERGLWNQAGPINPVVREPTDGETAYGVRFPRIEHEPMPADETDPPPGR